MSHCFGLKIKYHLVNKRNANLNVKKRKQNQFNWKKKNKFENFGFIENFR